MKMTPPQIIRLAGRAPEFWIEPDAFLRYLPVIAWVRKQKTPPKILEIGSGDFGLSTYLQYPLVKVDISFSKPPQPLAPKAFADASKLPFRDRSFDFVFAVDLLEHIDSKKRTEVLKEMVRASRNQVLVIFPCGGESREQDLKVAEDFEKMGKGKLAVLKTHEQIPFPEESEITGWIGRISHEIENWGFRKSFNLKLREKFVRGWLEQNRFALSATQQLLRFPALSRLLHFGKCYRRIVSIQVKNS